MSDVDDDSSYSDGNNQQADQEEEDDGGFIGVRALQPSGPSLDRYRLRDFPLGSAFAFDVSPSAVQAKICLTAGARLCISAATIEEVDDESDDEDEEESGSDDSDGVERAVLTINTPGDASDDTDGYGDADETMTLWDYRRGDSRTITSLGIAVSGPVVLSLGAKCRSKGLKAINVFGSVVLDDQIVSYGYDDDDDDISDGELEEEDLMQQLMEEERAELEEDAADPVDIVPAIEEDVSSHEKEKKSKKSKKRKMSIDENVEDDTGAAAEDVDAEKPLSKKQRKKLAKKKAQELADAVAKEQGYDKKQEKEKKTDDKKKKAPTRSLTRERRIEGGVLVRDIVVGAGHSVKPGRKVSINYEGSLASDGTVFDKNKSKADPLSFRPGTGEVIRGLEKGMEGMKVGGERIITIPPSMGYGKKGNAVIPKNATLVFTVNLLSVGGK